MLVFIYKIDFLIHSWVLNCSFKQSDIQHLPITEHVVVCVCCWDQTHHLLYARQAFSYWAISVSFLWCLFLSVFIYKLGWPSAHCVAQYGLKLETLLPQPHKWRDMCNHTPMTQITYVSQVSQFGIIKFLNYIFWVCVCVHSHIKAHMWKSEDNFWKSVLLSCGSCWGSNSGEYA